MAEETYYLQQKRYLNFEETGNTTEKIHPHLIAVERVSVDFPAKKRKTINQTTGKRKSEKRDLYLMIKSAATLQQAFAYRKLPFDLPVATSDYESDSDSVANEHAHTFSSLQTFESCQLSVRVLC